MKNKTTFLGITALLLTAVSGFASIPSTIWHTNDTTSYFDMWNKSNLDTSFFWEHSANWGVQSPGTDSAMITTDGAAHPSNWTNLVWKWQADSSQKDFVIRFTWRMISPSGNSGFNIRGFCRTGQTIATLCGGASQGYQVWGPQIDLGPTYTGDIWNSGIGGNLGPTAPNACAVATATFQDMEMVMRNDTLSTYYYPNGFSAANPTFCTRSALTDSRTTAATTPGLFALQYETTRISQFKNIKIRNLKATATAIHSVGKSHLSSVTGGRGAVEFSIPISGRYSVQISDIKGAVVKNLQGTGPVAHQKMALSQAGVYFVRISSSHETFTKKILAD